MDLDKIHVVDVFDHSGIRTRTMHGRNTRHKFCIAVTYDEL
jgi:hypothetical protein